MESVIFVCLGNICRSPIAEGIAKHIAKKEGLKIKISSAGTGSWHVGKPPCENSIKVAKQNGIDIYSLRASQITQKELEVYQYVIALDTNNYNDLKRLGAKNIYKLGVFGYDGKDIPDPYFFDGFDGFEEVYSMIETCVKNMFLSLA
jgi:protein-tyrosine phosphatase